MTVPFILPVCETCCVWWRVAAANTRPTTTAAAATGNDEDAAVCRINTCPTRGCLSAAVSTAKPTPPAGLGVSVVRQSSRHISSSRRIAYTSAKMRPIATDVARSVVRVFVCVSVCWARRWAVQKTAESIEMPFGADWYGSKEPCIRWGQYRTNSFSAARGDGLLWTLAQCVYVEQWRLRVNDIGDRKNGKGGEECEGSCLFHRRYRE